MLISANVSNTKTNLMKNVRERRVDQYPPLSLLFDVEMEPGVTSLNNGCA